MSKNISINFKAEGEKAPWVRTPHIVYEDEDLVVVHKPRQMHSVSHNGVSHAAASPDDLRDNLIDSALKDNVQRGSVGEEKPREQKDQTLADWLTGKIPVCRLASPSPLEGGLVQRLDYFTSGLLVAAKTCQAWEKLRESQTDAQSNTQFNAGFIKRYNVLVEGCGDQWQEKPPFVVTQPLYYKKGGKRAYYSRKGNNFRKFPAESRVSKLRALRGKEIRCLVVEVESSNLRRHQVRAHLSWVGSPLVGDALYNAVNSLEDCRTLLLDGFTQSDLEGFLLHASYIKFPHPRSGNVIECSSSFPYIRGYIRGNFK